jgi:hypothetical protein
MDGMNGNKWATTSSIHILLTSLFYHSTLHRLNKKRTERNGGWLSRRPKLTLSCSAEGKEGRKLRVSFSTNKESILNCKIYWIPKIINYLSHKYLFYSSHWMNTTILNCLPPYRNDVIWYRTRKIFGGVSCRGRKLAVQSCVASGHVWATSCV